MIRTTRTIRATRALTIFSALLVLAAGTRLAAQSISVEQVSCFKSADNQVVRATTAGEPGGASARLYFQWSDHPEYYWVDLEHDGPGRFWATPPKPQTRNKEVEDYGALLDAAR